LFYGFAIFTFDVGWLVGLWCLTSLSTIFQLYLLMSICLVEKYVVMFYIECSDWKCSYNVLFI